MKFLCLFAATTLCLVSHAANQAPETAEPQNSSANTLPPETKSYMMIDPQSRAMDFQQAYEFLRKEKTPNKVFFQIADGSMISNIIDMTIMANGTMILFKFNSPQGIKLQFVPLENIVSVNHL
jgi:hypothetical protein